MNDGAPGPGDSCSPTVAAAAAPKQRRWRCATKTRRTAAGKPTRAGSLPPPPSQYDGTRVNEWCTTLRVVCARTIIILWWCFRAREWTAASDGARWRRRVVCGNYRRRNTCPRRSSRPKRYRGTFPILHDRQQYYNTCVYA